MSTRQKPFVPSGSLLLIVLMVAAFPVLAADNAQFIKAVTPDTLITDQVFNAKFYFKNAGTTTWGAGANQTAVTLVSQSPKFNVSWGTYFIILGQGNSVAPGDTFAFSSPLKAPSSPGTYSMSWQCQNWISWDTTKPFFGEIGTKTTILVKPRTGNPPPAPAHKDSLLDTSDFEYAGSFKLPALAGEENLYTESGIALRTVGTSRHLLLRTGTYDYRLYEIAIPALRKISNNDYSAIATASTIRDWGDLGSGTINGEAIVSNGGFWFNDSSSILYWSHYNSYYTGGPGDFPELIATRLNTDGTKTTIKHWYIPGFPAKYKGYWGGVTKLTKSFADTYTGGRDMAVGFGGYYSICGSASRGPALGAIATPGMTDSVLDLVEMVTYPDPIACPRYGNYLPQVGFWNDFPASPWQGKWTYDDYCRAGVFIDLPDKRGFLAFVQQVTGRIGYDYGGYNTDGHMQNCWYFYDIKDLGAAAKGQKKATDILPSSYATVAYPANGGLVPGACFDPESRMVYIYQQWALDSRDPAVHVYHIKLGASAVRMNIHADRASFNPSIICGKSSASVTTISLRGIAPGCNQIDFAVHTIKGSRIAEWDLAGPESENGFLWNTSKIPKGIYLVTAKIGNTRIATKVTLAK